MLLLYIVDITDHEGLLSLLLGATDVPQQHVQQWPCQKEKETQPAHKYMQTGRGTQHDLREPQMPPDLPHQETHPAAKDVDLATQQEQELLWGLLTGQGCHMAAIRKYKTKLVSLMDQLVNVVKNSYMLQVKGIMSDENIIFAHDVIEAAKEINK